MKTPPTIFGPGPSIPDFHIGPQQPASDIVFGPSPMQPTPLIDFKSTNRYVKLFGKKMPLVLRSKTCWTWSANFGPITASVQFQDDSLFPWSAQIENGKVLEHSGCADVLQIERWVEDQLLAIRKTITELIPERKPSMSNITNVPRNAPKLFNIPFELISDPDSSIQTWELELFTCRFVLSHYPDIHELHQESHVILTRDSHRMHKCKTLEEATEYLSAQLQPSLMLVISKVRNT